MEFRNINEFESFVDKKAKQFAKKVVTQAKIIFKKKIDQLNKSFLNSSDFNDIKGRLVGEYGFTSEEVISLDNIVAAMERVSNVTESKDSFVIEYVNLKALHNQPEAQHGLTSQSNRGEVISWTEWLEEGVSIIGSSYSDQDSPNSRSQQGIMKDGGAWRLRPTRAFSNLAKEIGLKAAKDMMTLAVRKVRK